MAASVSRTLALIEADFIVELLPLLQETGRSVADRHRDLSAAQICSALGAALLAAWRIYTHMDDRLPTSRHLLNGALAQGLDAAHCRALTAAVVRNGANRTRAQLDDRSETAVGSTLQVAAANAAIRCSQSRARQARETQIAESSNADLSRLAAAAAMKSHRAARREQ